MALRFTLTIDLGNDAMQTNEDVAAALRKVAKQITSPDSGYASNARLYLEDSHKIMDINGNSVGKWRVTRSSND